jgi:hypothetical protein
MRIASIVAAALAFGACTFAMACDARALGPVDVEIGARVGVATNPASNGVDLNPLGFGLGARGGVDFLGFYGGVQFMYYLGGTASSAALCGPITSCGVATFSTDTIMAGAEVGYGLTVIDVFTLRPQIGLGDATFRSSASGPGVTNPGSRGSSSNLYLEPGVTGLFLMRGWFAGVDVNALFFPGMNDAQTAFSLHGQVGLKF